MYKDISYDRVMEVIIKAMKIVSYQKITGLEKKAFVMDVINLVTNGQVSDTIVSSIIDTLISVEKRRIVLNPKIKNKFFCCK
jgi:hypothetical protein